MSDDMIIFLIIFGCMVFFLKDTRAGVCKMMIYTLLIYAVAKALVHGTGMEILISDGLHLIGSALAACMVIVFVIIMCLKMIIILFL